MSAFLPNRPEGAPPEPETTVLVDGVHTVQEVRRRWEVRAAQWRAREIAEMVFGVSVDARMMVTAERAGFRGILRLAVPFDDLEAHRRREVRFMALAGSDDVLAAVRLVYVFDAVETVGGGG